MRTPRLLRNWRRRRYARLLDEAGRVGAIDPLQHVLAITRMRAGELADITGLAADDIEAEIIRREITPGDWARKHGLDPISFRPRP